MLRSELQRWIRKPWRVSNSVRKGLSWAAQLESEEPLCFGLGSYVAVRMLLVFEGLLHYFLLYTWHCSLPHDGFGCLAIFSVCVKCLRDLFHSAM